ncbi:hypothetical protein X777_01115 [Ooceraea biroi]|uniref:Uncharacterized protein n=1 Tax=Ooceraea biroi TaxID=2015173 RepID=A0A026WTR7_OOCBI|nr:hypothetical protein X777_01115 [Ooceraea biroi]
MSAVSINLHISTRKIEQQHGIPKSTANRILKTNKFHPYYIHLTQHLEQRDFQRRLRFSIEGALLDITGIIIRMKILIGKEIRNFKGSGLLTSGQELLAITSLVHIFLKKTSIGFRDVTKCLNNQFPNQWIGWGYVKQRIYVQEPTTTDDMKNRIQEALKSINAGTLQKVHDDFSRRLHLCIQVNGDVFEHLE